MHVKHLFCSYVGVRVGDFRCNSCGRFVADFPLRLSEERRDAGERLWCSADADMCDGELLRVFSSRVGIGAVSGAGGSPSKVSK